LSDDSCEKKLPAASTTLVIVDPIEVANGVI